jgi:hypothetical protein
VAAERWDEQVGSVADEAARLLESLRRSAETAAAQPPAGEASTAPPPDDEPDAVPVTPVGAAPHDPFCTWCPLCRGAAVVRSLSPETLARLADLATLAASVLTDLASSRPGPAPDAASDDAGRDPASGPAPTPRRRPRRPARAEPRPIPVTDADDPQEAPRG